jgi:hypothetical protein
LFDIRFERDEAAEMPSKGKGKTKQPRKNSGAVYCSNKEAAIFSVYYITA